MKSLSEAGDDEAAARVGLPVLAYGDDYPIDILANNVAASLLLWLDVAERLSLWKMKAANPSLICSAGARLLEIAARLEVLLAERAPAVDALLGHGRHLIAQPRQTPTECCHRRLDLARPPPPHFDGR